MASTHPIPAFSLRHALAWTLFTTIVLSLGITLLTRLAPAAAGNVIAGGALETVIYAAGALALVGTAGNWRERLRMLGFTRAPAWLLLTGFFLGVTVHGPADFLAAWIERWVPHRDAVLIEQLRRLSPSSSVERAGVFAIAALIVPLVEEVFFRGALFARLRLPGSRATALAVSGACFVVCHLDPTLWLPLAVVALVLTLVRAAGRGIWPCFLLHASFNATTLALTFSRAPEAPIRPEPSIAFAVAGTAASALLLAGVLRHVDLGRREFA